MRLTKCRPIPLARSITSHQHIKGSSPSYSSPDHPSLIPPSSSTTWKSHQFITTKRPLTLTFTPMVSSPHHPPSTTHPDTEDRQHRVTLHIQFCSLCHIKSYRAEAFWRLWEKQKKLRKLSKIWGFGMLIGDNDVSFFKPLGTVRKSTSWPVSPGIRIQLNGGQIRNKV